MNDNPWRCCLALLTTPCVKPCPLPPVLHPPCRPVQLLRLVLNAGIFVFFVSVFTVFLPAYNCNWFYSEQPVRLWAHQRSELHALCPLLSVLAPVH